MSKAQGELTELMFYTLAYRKGWIVSKPFGDNARYDFIVDATGRLSRVQVKSTSVKDHTGRHDRYTAVIAHGCKGKLRYTKNDVDLIAVYVIPENAWYIIPIAELGGSIKINIRPFSPNSKGKYERFKEAWDLFHH